MVKIWATRFGPSGRRAARRVEFVQYCLNALTMASPTYVLTLVHGTFAAHAIWCKPDSPFAQDICAALPSGSICRKFGWSGENTHQARLDAGERLAAQLSEQMLAFPNSKHFLIAHSHGGNISLYAQNNAAVQGKLSGVVTLGTPFIQCEPRQVEKLMAAISFTLMCLYFLFFLGMTGLVLWFICSFYTNMLVGILGVLFIFGGVGWLQENKDFLEKKSARLKARLTEWGLEKQMETSQRLSLHASDLAPMLTVTVTDDEAGRWLRAIRAIGNVAPRLSRPLDRIIPGCVGLSFLAFCVWLFIALLKYGSWIPTIQQWTTGAAMLVWGLTALCCIVFAALQMAAITSQMAVRSHRFGFGGEAVIDNWLSDIYVVESPANVKADAFQSTATESGLRHSSFFQNEGLRGEIARWILKTTGIHG
jgi:hypothetical protein